jgi:hypothetical protein
MAHLNLENEVVFKKDIDKVTDVLVDLFNFTPTKEAKSIQNQALVLENFEQFLIKLLTTDVLPTREQRFEVANFLYKIQLKRETIALMKGELDMEDIKKAAESLGKKWTIPETEPFGIGISAR